MNDLPLFRARTRTRRPTLNPFLNSLATALGLFLLCPSGRAQITEVGEPARAFSIVNRATSEPIRLADFEGQVLVLDFFAYWCGPCRQSSPDLEVNVNEYYHARNGNAHGVPVTVLPVNIESNNEPATDLFVQEFGLDPVANDYLGNAYSQFATGFIPLFVIINGVADSPSHQQWEVLYRDSGYPGAEPLRALIDAVEAGNPTAPPAVLTQPRGGTFLAGTTAALEVRASGAAPLTFQWFKDGTAITGATGATLVLGSVEPVDSGAYHVVITNDFGSAQSAAVAVEVRLPGPVFSTAYEGAPLAIPDANAAGITSRLTVDQPAMLLRLRVSVQITHTFIGDLQVSLRAPWGDTVVLHDLAGGASMNLTISLREISDFNGRDPRGTWSLLVSDQAQQDTGTLDHWSLELMGAAPTFAEDFARWMEQYTALPAPARVAGADPDLDGIPNLLEYALATTGPDSPDAVPLPAASVTHPDHLELVLTWRPGVDTAMFETWICEDLAAGDWTEVANRGNDIIVDRSDPTRLNLFLHRSLPQVFVQLRSKPDAL